MTFCVISTDVCDGVVSNVIKIKTENLCFKIDSLFYLATTVLIFHGHFNEPVGVTLSG